MRFDACDKHKLGTVAVVFKKYDPSLKIIYFIKVKEIVLFYSKSLMIIANFKLSNSLINVQIAF